MTNRNQHFVSQVYLRRFGVLGERDEPKAINLFAIGPKKIVYGASIKHQASRRYFYGQEQAFEVLLQFFEGRYGTSISRTEAGELSKADLKTLVQFMLLQYLRTSFQLYERLRIIDELRAQEIAGRSVRNSLGPPDAAREAQQQLHIFAKEYSTFDDLVPVILINKTKFPFISSDNPAICMNRLYAQRYDDETAGLIQSGILACMPLTPRIQLIAYDQDVYRSFGKEQVFEVRNENDVHRFNELQIVRAADVLFFQSADNDAYVAELFDKFQGRRRSEWTISWQGIRDGRAGDFERYRKVTPEDKDSLEPRIQSISPILPTPSTWPSFVKFRMRPTGWSNGSTVGFVRAAHRRRGGGLRHMTLPQRVPSNQVPSRREEIYQHKGAERSSAREP